MSKRFTRQGETVIGGVDSNNVPKHAIIDRSGSLVSMIREHYEVHTGGHYFFTDKFTLASAATKEYLIQTPTDVSVHMHFVFEGSAITQFDIYEDAGLIGTTDNIQTLFNSNRNSSNTSEMILYTSPTTDSGDGTLLKSFGGGSATNQSKIGDNDSSAEEIVLKKNAKYLIRYTSGTADNLCDIYLHWYEV